MLDNFNIKMLQLELSYFANNVEYFNSKNARYAHIGTP